MALPGEMMEHILSFAGSIRLFRAIERFNDNTDMSALPDVDQMTMREACEEVYHYVYKVAVAEEDMPAGVDYNDYKRSIGMAGFMDLGKPSPTVETTVGSDAPRVYYFQWFFSTYQGQQTYAFFKYDDEELETVWLRREPRFYEEWVEELDHGDGLTRQEYIRMFL